MNDLFQKKLSKKIRLKFIVHIIAIFVCPSLMLYAALADDRHEIARNGSFIAYSNGVVEDTKTGLEWIAGPDKDTSYYKARNWVRNLRIDGDKWRMPTNEELKTLYGKDNKLSSITPLLKTTGIHIWPAQIDEDNSLYLFGYMDPYGTRGFAVRSK